MAVDVDVGEEAESFEEATGLRDINTPEAILMTKQIAQITGQKPAVMKPGTTAKLGVNVES